jgi:predicted RNA binding protein YcfA (HicA-like mRNA interferase family)
MRLALAAVASGKGSHRELQHAAHELVTELKQAKHPPEQMLVHIKEILAEAGIRPTYASSPGFDGPPADGAAIYRDVIGWSIRSYYGDGDGAVQV